MDLRYRIDRRANWIDRAESNNKVRKLTLKRGNIIVGYGAKERPVAEHYDLTDTGPASFLSPDWN
jgi:hypothetical protein